MKAVMNFHGDGTFTITFDDESYTFPTAYAMDFAYLMHSADCPRDFLAFKTRIKEDYEVLNALLT